ncbi:hypothetical protein [Alkalibaculum bacchi]|uniref:hypothetical protein n=1 Tax=Alkalibaculum bacchi TaxID=645887 RepID=UPI0026F28BF6|nr:hypothetical protein [Alkalibaculum bacchi]
MAVTGSDVTLSRAEENYTEVYDVTYKPRGYKTIYGENALINADELPNVRVLSSNRPEMAEPLCRGVSEDE